MSDRNCTKNIGHVNFIPAKEFSVEHVDKYLPALPENITKEEIVELVSALYPLTVKIRGTWISDYRPSDSHYPLSRHRGTQVNNVGSGWMYFAHTMGVKSSRKLYVYTAKHVIYNQSEAGKCDMILFDDGLTKPLVLKGWTYVRGDRDEDWSELEFDLAKLKSSFSENDLAQLWEKIRRLCERRDNVVERFERKLKADDRPVDHIDSLADSPIVVIGYPHARMCYVTGGRLYAKVGEEFTILPSTISFQYTADTCPGNAGAMVVSVAPRGVFKNLKCYLHSGASSVTSASPEPGGSADASGADRVER